MTGTGPLQLERLLYTSGQNLSTNPMMHQQPLAGPSQLYYQNNQIYHRHQYPSEPSQSATANSNCFYMDSAHQFMSQQQNNYTPLSGPQVLSSYSGPLDPPQGHYLNQINLGYTTTNQEVSTHQEPLEAGTQPPESHCFPAPPVQHQQYPETGDSLFFQMTATGSQPQSRLHYTDQFHPWISSAPSYPVAGSSMPHESDLVDIKPDPIYHQLPSNMDKSARYTSLANHHANDPKVQGSEYVKLEAPKTHNLKPHRRHMLGYGVTARRKNATRETTGHLKIWLEDHSHNPYPSKAEKMMMSMAANLSMTQVSTWFANARRRLKKENKMLSWVIQRPPAVTSSLSTFGSTTGSSNHLSNNLDQQGRSFMAHQETNRSHAIKYLMNRHYLGPGLGLSTQAYPDSKQDRQFSSVAQPCSDATSGPRISREKVVRLAQSSRQVSRVASQNSISSSNHSISNNSAETNPPQPAAKWNSLRHRKRAFRNSRDRDNAPSTTTAAC